MTSPPHSITCIQAQIQSPQIKSEFTKPPIELLTAKTKLTHIESKPSAIQFEIVTKRIKGPRDEARWCQVWAAWFLTAMPFLTAGEEPGRPSSPCHAARRLLLRRRG
ncbi:hypothetical protein SEVIR_6G180600v4 [Setaria viridis]|uniref:Uncharacterized protein n=2 Tax=Setaria TaxID=4554 RepID=A0A368RMH3_SETIT|nr:hypothetical protein SETIT_6G174500v2 [Setaria italica]TKW10659.1 hypothetical protein SEVIR_6G180600v2 [Setaria viridis]